MQNVLHLYIYLSRCCHAMLQAHFTATLLRDMAGIEFPMERIFSTTASGQPKTEVLEKIQNDHPELNYIFIEDKFSTLDKASAVLMPSERIHVSVVIYDAAELLF